MKPNHFQKSDGSLTRFGRFVSVVAVLLIGLVAYLTVNPEAHDYFHKTAGHDDHECVVTAFAVGEALYLAPAILMRPATVVVERIHFRSGDVLRDPVAQVLPPVCGPPVRSMIA